MTTDYRIEPAGTAFKVIDPLGEYRVDLSPTREAAQHGLDRCKREDEMYETAKQLVHAAIEAHIQKFGIDRETTQYWIHSAMGG